MKFISEGLSNTFRKQCKAAEAVDIAVAYFGPEEVALQALQSVPHLRIVISGEFDKNNPYKLETLKKGNLICEVPRYERRLHSKVYLFHHKQGHKTALVGSANLTYGGLVSNREACVFLDSRKGRDRRVLKELTDWFEEILSQAKKLDWELAKQIFDKTSHRDTSVDKWNGSAPPSGLVYWAIKTRPGTMEVDHWCHFKAEGVIAIGWDIGRNPLTLSQTALLKALSKTQDLKGEPRKARLALDTILKFNGKIKKGDVVVICKGYPANQIIDFTLYGVARVTGPAYYDNASNWKWKLKRPAEIQVIEQKVPLKLVKKALKGSLTRTIHHITHDEYEHLRKVLRHDFGIRLDF